MGKERVHAVIGSPPVRLGGLSYMGDSHLATKAMGEWHGVQLKGPAGNELHMGARHADVTVW